MTSQVVGSCDGGVRHLILETTYAVVFDDCTAQYLKSILQKV